jgi:hypothetical protein
MSNVSFARPRSGSEPASFAYRASLARGPRSRARAEFLRTLERVSGAWKGEFPAIEDAPFEEP